MEKLINFLLVCRDIKAIILKRFCFTYWQKNCFYVQIFLFKQRSDGLNIKNLNFLFLKTFFEREFYVFKNALYES